MKKLLRFWDLIPIFLVSAFITFLLSCSSFNNDGEGSIKIKFDSQLLQQITASRTALSDAESAGDYQYYEISAQISGDYSDSTSHKLSTSEMNALESIIVSFSSVPAGSNVSVSVALNKVYAYGGHSGQEHYEESKNSANTIYSGSQNITVSPGTNNIVISMKNATAPYFTKSTKSGFVKQNDDESEINLYATVAVPENSYNFYYLQANNFYAFKYNSYDSKSFNSADLLSKFSEYYKSLIENNAGSPEISDDYTFYNVKNSYSSYDRNEGTFSLEQSYSPYTLTGSFTIDNDKEISAYYTGWIVVYTNPLGEEKYLFSDIAKFTVLDENTEFSIESVTYNSSTGAGYELIDSFSKENFKIIEKWGGTKIEGDIVNYSAAFEDFPANYIGEKEFEFSRNGCEPELCKVTFKYKIPDFSGFILTNNYDGTISINFDSKNLTETDYSLYYSVYNIVSNPDYNIPAYSLEGEDAEKGYTITYNWSKNGTPLGERYQSQPKLNTSSLTDGETDGETSTFALTITITPNENLKEYCVNPASKTYNYGSISISATDTTDANTATDTTDANTASDEQKN